MIIRKKKKKKERRESSVMNKTSAGQHIFFLIWKLKRKSLTQTLSFIAFFLYFKSIFL